VSARGRAGILLLAALLLGSACRFEKRPDLAAREPADSIYLPGVGPVQDSVMAIIDAIIEAFRVGDVSRVAQLTTRDAVLLDRDGEIRWTRPDAAAPLPPPLRGGADSVAWRLERSSFALLTDGVALASLELHGEAAVDSASASAVESWVAVREAPGWRVRYLHRSRHDVEIEREP
jgi:ketosteroid isomerase-like protein